MHCQHEGAREYLSRLEAQSPTQTTVGAAQVSVLAADAARASVLVTCRFAAASGVDAACEIAVMDGANRRPLVVLTPGTAYAMLRREDIGHWCAAELVAIASAAGQTVTCTPVRWRKE